VLLYENGDTTDDGTSVGQNEHMQEMMAKMKADRNANQDILARMEANRESS
jgi:roadblock/LC7 domain-containing protein